MKNYNLRYLVIKKNFFSNWWTIFVFVILSIIWYYFLMFYLNSFYTYEKIFIVFIYLLLCAMGYYVQKDKNFIVKTIFKDYKLSEMIIEIIKSLKYWFK